ncbi:TonB-dependent receptor plug domain-containing protein [Altererythrobacter sp. GH1-8]|uniref:TonB-dependent receptor plug domain-containing protein n=1 Tax=Altererythrobacter sp. GH1-8 TaxID=3349333 RepID=UPI00374D053E
MRLNVLKCSAAFAALCLNSGALAQETETRTAIVEDSEGNAVSSVYGTVPIVVVESRSGQIDLADSTGALSFVDAEELEQRQARDIADVLRDVPGVSVSSVPGQTQLRLRGSEANHVLVLVDGIEVSDPFGGEFDIGTLQAEIGSRVEVLRGPQSALYGSDAIGGVVAYESGSFDGFAARLEGGSQNTINGAARFGFEGDTFDASLAATVVSSDGEPNARGGVRDIGRDSYTLSGKGEVELGGVLTLRGSARYILTEGEFNDQDFNSFPSAGPTFGLVIDSPDTRYENEAVYGLVGANLSTMGGRWTHDLSAQIADIRRDSFGPFGRSFGSKGDRLKASYVSALALGQHSLTFAADWERERFQNTDPFGFAFTGKCTIENIGLSGEYRYAGERFDLSAAIRHDFNDRFADETTFRLGAAVDATESTRLHASYGTGIKNPGFYELFGFIDGRFIGNENLTPEKSESWEVGVTQGFADERANISITYFDANLEGEIFTSFPAPEFVATPANRATRSDREGVEVSARARLGPQVTLDAAYTWLNAEENGVDEVRRPSSIASAVLTWTAPNDKASATLIVRHNGATDDVAFLDPSFVPTTVRLDDYTLVNINARYRLTDRLEVFARVENLFDTTYEQVFSFVSPGRSAAVGFRVSL